MALIKIMNASVNFGEARSERKLFPSLFSRKEEISSVPFSLKDINLEFKSGDRVGLIGRNGAGKTTLLRVISKIIKPTNGDILTLGSVASLFGPIPFISQLNTAVQNVKIFATLNKLNKFEAKRVEDDVRAFADIGKYFDQPLHTYSAGMLARFNFAILTSIPKDILVMDEAIGAGDIFFRQKIETRLQHLYEGAQIIVVASHSNTLIKQLCNTCVLLDDGLIKFQGGIDECLSIYQRDF